MKELTAVRRSKALVLHMKLLNILLALAAAMLLVIQHDPLKGALTEAYLSVRLAVLIMVIVAITNLYSSVRKR
jgi:hypothetical protein